MKLQSILPAFLFVAVASMSFGAQADETEKKSQPENMMKRPHSHMEEKGGMVAKPKASAAAPDEKPQEAADAATGGKKKPQKDSHFHPRDGGK